MPDRPRDDGPATTHRLVVPAGAVGLLRGLVGQLVALHDGPDDDHPAWRRLYPATTADPQLDHDLRGLVHPDLVEGRRAAFARVGEVLGAVDDRAEEVTLDDDEAVAVLGVVNDIRIALAATADLPSLLDDRDDLPDDVSEETLVTLELVDWLAFLQEQLLASVAPESQAHFDDPVHDPPGTDGLGPADAPDDPTT